MHRDATRLKVTVEGLLKSVADDGRIHTTYSQTIAATGRLSSTEPNLQNVPIRTAAGRRIRDTFVVGADYAELMTADYSQIEMRIMAHLSGDAALIEAFRSHHDFHAETAARVFGVDATEVGPERRAKIKAMNYGLAYGLSAFGLSNQLRISTEEARGLMDDYFQTFGGVRDYLGGVVDQARKDGYTETILGRRRYLPDLTTDNRQRREMAERMALNAPIQGSAADIIKVAMLNVHRALQAEGLRSRMLLQVHDELVLEVARRRARRGRGAGAPGDGRGVRAVGAAGGVGGLRAQLGPGRALSAGNTAARTPDASGTARRCPGASRSRGTTRCPPAPGGSSSPAPPARARPRWPWRSPAVSGIPHTDIDGLYHGPGWVPRPEFVDDVAALVAESEWVTEWQYSVVRPCCWRRADLLVWLDLTRARGDAPDRAADAAPAAAPRRAVERQRRTAAVDDLHRRDHILRWAWRTHPKTAARVHGGARVRRPADGGAAAHPPRGARLARRPRRRPRSRPLIPRVATRDRRSSDARVATNVAR